MKKSLLLVAAFLIISLFAVPAIADFKFQLVNTTELKLVYFVYWLDHDWPKWPFPANIMGGELEVGKSHSSEYSYKEGSYIIEWYWEGVLIAIKDFTVASGTAMVIIKFDNVELCKGA